MPGLSPFNDPMTGAQINARLAGFGLTLPDDKFTITGSADATKTFKFELDGMATGVDITWTGGAQTADRSISLPVLTANDTLMTLGVAQTVTTLKTFSAGLTVSAGATSLQALTATSITNSSLTSGRIPFASTAGLMTDSAQFTFDQSGAIYSRVISLSGVGSCGWQTADGTRTWLFGSNSGTFQVYDATAAASRLQVNASGQLRVMVATGTSVLVSSTDNTALSCAGGASFAGPLSLTTASTGLTIAATSGTTLTVSSASATAISCAGGASLGGPLVATTATFSGTTGPASDGATNLGTTAIRWANVNALRLNTSRASSTDTAYTATVAGDTQLRFSIDAAGLLTWGAGGVTAPDTNLYRGAANQLKTDDDFVIGSTAATAFSCAGGIRSTSATAGIGYATGAGGTVTQLTSRSTGVTINKICGQITTNNTSLASGAEVSFVVTNSNIVATDVIALSIASGTTSADTKVSVAGVTNGSFTILVANLSGGAAETGAFIINFATLKAVSA